MASSGPVKFLLVDDIEENLTALEALLARPGLELLKARSGREALEHLLAHEVALALVDVQMPDMDGFELAELMRGAERTRHVPIIFVTAGNHEARRIFAGYEAGAVDFLIKPIDPHILRSKAEIFFQLHRQQQQLRETLRLNETFLAVVTHDLRTPLNAMLVGARLLSEGGTEPTGRQVAERIASSGQRMARLLDGLFDLARIRQTGGLDVQPRPGVDLLAVCQRSADELRLVHPGRSIELTSQGDPVGRWDPERLAQVFTNLLGNAVHHGTIERPVSLHLQGAAPDHVEVCISNSGQIPPDLLSHLFEPFYTTGGHRKGNGLGLGLFIAQQIVLAHKGQIQVESANSLTTFRVHLPRHAALGRSRKPHPRKILASCIA